MAHPLKVEARVRIPLGLPAKSQCRDRVNRRGARVGVEAAAVATDRRSPSDTHSCSTRTCSGRPARGSACGTVVDGVGGRRHCPLCHGGLRGADRDGPSLACLAVGRRRSLLREGSRPGRPVDGEEVGDGLGAGHGMLSGVVVGCCQRGPGRLPAARRDGRTQKVPGRRGAAGHPLKVEARVRIPLGLPLKAQLRGAFFWQ